MGFEISILRSRAEEKVAKKVDEAEDVFLGEAFVLLNSSKLEDHVEKGG